MMGLQEYMNGIVDVKNMENTSDENQAVWIDGWERETGKKANKCSIIGCNNKPPKGDRLHGGHIKKVNSSDDTPYITPLCRVDNHYSMSDEFRVHKSDLVPAKDCE